MKNVFTSIVASAVICCSLATSVAAAPAPGMGQPTAARNLHATRTPSGYRLSGQLQSSNTCMNTRFLHVGAPDSFVAQQYKRPGSGPICGFIVTWKNTVLNVLEHHTGRYARVRVAGGRVINVPISPVIHPL